MMNPAYQLLGSFNSEPMLFAQNVGGLPALLKQTMAIDPTQVQDAHAEFMRAYAATLQAEEHATGLFVQLGSTAVIPITGSLVNRFNGAWGSVTGYDYIRMAFDAANIDPSISSIAFDVNSPGGQVHGCFELADHIVASKSKPLTAIVNASAYSAAYALSSTADRIVVTPSGGAGSIGVVCMHIDVSKALEDFGVKVRFVYAGADKVAGNMFGPLSDSVRAEWQARIDATYDQFVSMVARNRRLSPAAVRGTEARCFDASGALAAGLIDEIAAPSTAFAAFIQSTQRTEVRMSTEVEVPEAAVPAAEAPAVDAAAAASAERARIQAIQSHEAAAGREELAAHLAFNTSMSPDEAAAILSASPKKASNPADSGFMAAMNGSQHPEVGSEADAGATAEANEPKNVAERMLRNYSAATGIKLG